MCLGVPLQVRSVLETGAARCAAAGGEALREVDVSLLDKAPAVGDWVLVHVNIAIRVLDVQEARQIGDALAAVEEAAAGRPFEHLLADLVDREPQLPEWLRPSADVAGETTAPSGAGQLRLPGARRG